MTSEGPQTPSTEELRKRFEALGQGHVFRFWGQLSPEGQQRLATQAEGFDLPALLSGYAAAQVPTAAAGVLEPVEAERLPGHGGDPARHAAAARAGEELLGAGRVAVFVVAGGQGTRLGWSGPKGTFPIGPVSARTLFALQAQKIRRLRARHAQPIPWYVMTSPATDAETRKAFDEAGCFGLPSDDVFFLCQAMVPGFDAEGRIALERPDRIFENPDGHGGSLVALASSGALDDMAARGIDTIFYYQVDNPLVPIGDPILLGFHAETGAEMSCKVLRKRDPDEKVGVYARHSGHIGVVEYTELEEPSRSQRDDRGDLVFWAGNMACHTFDTGFVRRVAADADRLLPFHASSKKIPTVDADGVITTPEHPNGTKLERFVFDALAATHRVALVEVDRDEEFEPVKNAAGAESAATARAALCARYRAWLAGADLSPPPEPTRLEIDESRVAGVEDLRALGLRRIEDAGDLLRVASGDEA